MLDAFDPRRDRRRVVVASSEPGPDERRLVVPVHAPRRRSSARDWSVRSRRMASSRATSSRSRAPCSRRRRSSAGPAIAQPALRPLQRGGRPRARPTPPGRGHVPQVVVRGRLHGRPLARRPVRGAARSRDQPRARRRPARAPAAAPAATAAETAGRRRTRRASRWSAFSGRAVIGSPRRKRRRSSASAAASAYRAAAPCAGTSGRSSPGRAAPCAFSRDGGTGSCVTHLLQRLRRRLGPERRPAREQLVEDRPQGVDVRGRPDRARAGPGPARGPCSSASPPRRRSASAPASPSRRRARPKSVTLGVPSAVSRTLAGFRSRWTIPPLVRRLRRRRPASPPARRPAGPAEGVAGDALGQAAALDELHGEVRPAVELADVVDLHDVGVPQAGHRLRLAPEPLPLARAGEGAGQQHLQGDGAVEPQVPRPGRRRPCRRGPAPHAPRSRGPAAGPSAAAARPRGRRADPGSGNSASSSGLDAAEPPATAADLGQQLGAVAADLFRRSGPSRASPRAAAAHAGRRPSAGPPRADYGARRAPRPRRAEVVQPLAPAGAGPGSTAAAPS